jgi:uncharacterized protein (TIGR00369 family)
VTGFQPADPNYDARVRDSFRRQTIMKTIGAVLTHVAPGAVDIALSFHDGLTQQHGYLHAGILTAIADSACGYAALSLSPTGTEVLTVEYKVNFLEPARGARFIARGRVLRPGRTVTVCRSDVLSVDDQAEVAAAVMLATIIRVTAHL